MRDLMILFLPYFGVGIFTGVNLHDIRHWEAKSLLILAGVYTAFAGFAYLLATKSRNKDGTPRFGLRLALSTTSWVIGFVMSFAVGFSLAVLPDGVLKKFMP